MSRQQIEANHESRQQIGANHVEQHTLSHRENPGQTADVFTPTD
jgi:hypothetical protein